MITAKYVPYNLLNYKKDVSQRPWNFDINSWEGLPMPKYHKTPFRNKAHFNESLEIYLRLVLGEKISVKQLINNAGRGEIRFRLSLQVTENFPEIFLKDNGWLLLDLKVKKEREKHCIKHHLRYTPWSRKDEL